MLPALLLIGELLVAHADTADIHMRLSSDRGCIGWISSRVLLNEGCYADLQRGTGAFNLKIVKYDVPRSLDIALYDSQCSDWDLTTDKRQVLVQEGSCVPFPEVTSSTYAEFTLLERSSICGGNPDLCSGLVTVQQQFYTGARCTGAPLVDQFFEYPASGECLITNNGTMRFNINPAAPNNITQTVYSGSHNCGTPDANGNTEPFVERTYSIDGGNCYDLYSDEAPRSFMWQTYDIAGVYAASHAYRAQWMSVMVSAALVLLHHIAL